MSRVIANQKARALTKDELSKVSGGVSVFTGSTVKSGNPLVVESTDPGNDAGGGGTSGGNDGFIDPNDP